MDDILPNIDSELDVIFGEFRDQEVVRSFVAGIRSAAFTGTLYIGYPVLAIDDGRIEFDAVLISRDRGVVIFDLYSFSGTQTAGGAAIPDDVAAKQEQQHAALFNRLNSFRELRRGRSLIVELLTVSIHPIADMYIEKDESRLIGFDRLRQLPVLAPENRLDDEQIQHLNAAIQRISNLRPRKKRDNVVKVNSKGSVIKEIERQIANLDLWQKRGSIEYVNGPQRIRGLAGSGKTVVLALKAAYLHVKRPDWKIVVTFNTRSLYQQFEALITKFVFAQVNDEPDWARLMIMHAWGGSDRGGVYRHATTLAGTTYRDFGTAARVYGYEQAFDGACRELLSQAGSTTFEVYDMMLIDEAQDLPASFFQLAYRLVKDPKRIVWAYDDLQNLGDIHMPSERELFGTDEHGHQKVTLRNDADQPQQDIVLPRCYRNPPWTLVVAHGLGFGIKHDPIVQIFPDPKLWTRLGYSVVDGELGFDRDVSLARNQKSIPEFFHRLLTAESSLSVVRHRSSEDQHQWVAKSIRSLIDDEELQHSDFLIVIPDVRRSKSLGASLLQALRGVGLQGHVPGQTSSRDELFRDGSIAITHIHRAKGNEAPAVFVVDAQFCEAPFAAKKRRNILFTAITRSRAWTFISGYGNGMEQIEREIHAIRTEGFRLSFHYPTRDIAERLAVSTDTSFDEFLPVGDDFDDIREALRKAKSVPWERLPLDLRRDIQEIYGPEV